jgi:tRNA (guanosine-2'-O-)-methyltransferase
MSKKLTDNRLNKILSVASKRQDAIVILEDIYDPHNAAAVLRSCDGFGIQKVYFIFEKMEKFNPRKVGDVSSSSANKWLDFEVFDSTEKCLKSLKKQGYKIFGTVLNEKAKSIFKTSFKQPKVALMFGNEHRGLSEKAIELSDAQVYIPMQGFVQSFNLSVTAAICMYELFRQRNNFPKKFLMSKKERQKLVKIWGDK